MRNLQLVRRPFAALALLTAALTATACAPYKLKEPPVGLVSVESWEGHDRMKGGDDVGVTISSFGNYKGGSLAIWADDLVRKLGLRDYQLVRQTPVKSKNGVAGTRFDFDYVSPADDEKKFYTAILFVTDEWRVVVQVAGDDEHREAYASKTDAVLAKIKIRGCKIASKICKGEQPPALSTAGSEGAPIVSGDPKPVEPDPEPQPMPVEPDPAPGSGSESGAGDDIAGNGG